MLKELILLALVGALSNPCLGQPEFERTFTVDYERDTFLMNGKPFRFISGAFHYFRTHPDKWRPIFKTMRSGGLNTVDLYVYWGLHNPRDNEYVWTGMGDLEGVIKAAVAEDLFVILRPGPYICAELENGGHPYWLHTKYPNLVPRTVDINYLYEVEKWWSRLMGRMEKHLFGNGGPIIMVQVENEFGASEHGKCNEQYKNWLFRETRKYVGDKAVLFTNDMPKPEMLECGRIEGALVTLDFGADSDEKVDQHWKELRKVQPRGPLVVAEFWDGWFTHWQDRIQNVSTAAVASTLIKLLSDGANVNFYMYFGGTNLGFTSGASPDGIGGFNPHITSYDYDAPLNEAGDPTEKFYVLRRIIQEFFPNQTFPAVPKNRPVKLNDAITLVPRARLLDPEIRKRLNIFPRQFEHPPTFEALGQFSGLVLYETELPRLTRDPSLLTVNGLADRAYVFVDEQLAGTLSRENAIKSLPLSAGWGSKLSILVENQGRINWQVASDVKGILGEVQLQAYDEPYTTLTNWTVSGYPLESYSALQKIAFDTNLTTPVDPRGVLHSGPVVFSIRFRFPTLSSPLPDLYLNMENWGKGVIFYNGLNLGRYWSLGGPQMTMYVPGEALEWLDQEIVIVEYQKFNQEGMKLSFSSEPKFVK